MWKHWCAQLFVVLTLGSWALAQQNCPLAPAVQPSTPTENIFTDQQEVDLGDAVAEAVALHFNVIKDDELTAHLKQVGERLVRYLPPTKLNYRFYLIDLPEVNAFSSAGGRVYISRKIVAFARNDDELAGVVAHELGHIVTHQSAIEMTRAFREVLGVTQVGSRDDIFQKYHRFLENAALAKRGRSHSEGKHQSIADQVSVYTLARAGYAPSAMPEFWDRFQELHGKAGNWLSDLFGTTTPEQHRLRDMVRDMTALPHECTERALPNADQVFRAWRDTVIDFEETRQEQLPGLISKHRLSERLRPQIINLRFSQDGKYILAQDDGGIHVVSRNPFQTLFYIPAPDALQAKFTPDSTGVVVLAAGQRVERWNIAEHKRERVRELTIHDACLQSELSPDGTVLACLGEDYALQIIDIETGSVLSRKDRFYTPTWFDSFSLFLRRIMANIEDESTSTLQLMNMEFSPDGHYLLAASGGQTQGIVDLAPLSTLLFDLKGRSDVSLPGSIKKIVGVSFSFVGVNKVVGVNPDNPSKSPVLKFPSGEKISEVALSYGIRVRGAGGADAVIVGPMRDWPLAIMDLSTGKIFVGIKQPSADAYGDLFVSERLNGELALHRKGGTNETLATLPLPESRLGRLRTASVAPEFGYFAASTKTRSAVWDLQHDARVFHARGINGAAFYGSSIYADFPKFEGTPRSIADLNIDSHTVAVVREVKDEFLVQRGPYLLKTTFGKGAWHGSESDIEVEDVRSGQPLWQRHFRTTPLVQFNPENKTLMMLWSVSAAGVQDELKKFPAQQTAERDDLFCEVADANLGALSASFVFKTHHGTLRLLNAQATHEWAVVEANQNQILSYAMPEGREKGQFFGARPVLSSSGLLVVDSGKQELATYDLSTLQMRQQYVFSSPVAFKTFSEDGKRLFVFTSDQTVYILDAGATDDARSAAAVN
jgi:WD40 repeat protein